MISLNTKNYRKQKKEIVRKCFKVLKLYSCQGSRCAEHLAMAVHGTLFRVCL